MRTIIVIAIALVVIIIAVVLFFMVFMSGPDLEQYEFLKDPRITNMEDRRVLQVEVSGSPEEVLPKAFSALYSEYFKMPGVPKGPGQSAPLLRCNVPVDRPLSELAGQGYVTDRTWYIGLPVPWASQLTEPPGKGEPKPEIATWEYGEVAEILHIGPYEDELPTIERLQDFIKAKGYRFKGIHEEEYLRGPEKPFTKPEDYYTIIRYLVEKIK
ncbi:MAG: GyrI-like domain-containing protein [Spirochaetales bacterium]|nr:GyrI-like domain-containing protein [Spirochaetales bacterium]